MDPAGTLYVLLGIAVLLPLFAFALVLLAGPRLGKGLGHGAYVSIAAILVSCALSFLSLFIWLTAHKPEGAHHGHGQEHSQAHEQAGSQLTITPVSFAADDAPAEASAQPSEAPPSNADEHAANEHTSGEHTAGEHTAGEPCEEHVPIAYTGTYWTLAKFGPLELTISYYIDALTIVMFCMVTLIASCIHFYAMGYMHDELHDIVDHEVTLTSGEVLHRPGRFWRFFQYLSLFCFSMLGLVLAGNIFMVFCFWELVGICSYFLIGFYVERNSASTAANKAFIVNRVGDFGMIICLMALWSSLGTFAFGDVPVLNDAGAVVTNEAGEVVTKPGIFSQVRPAEYCHALIVPAGMVQDSAHAEVAELIHGLDPAAPQAEIDAAIAAKIPQWRGDQDGQPGHQHGYTLMIIAGVGIFCGCIGKSAQFPLQTWLPDAMEGPTPVSALVHSATMVAAGVYLVGRFYPVFVPEVLLVIAIVGTITLFMAATIAIVATDIKRVLAYSTISQLGYMMLALGIGGWVAGLMHLITHAFFKSLLFMCSGSVIHAVHTNEMPKMGGLFKKMPITAITMLIGCLAISGAGVPWTVGLSGYYSKDAILEQAYSIMKAHHSPYISLFFIAAAGGASITAFYMFRMWFLTFIGQPRERERYEHAHESPRVMYLPLIILSVFAVGVAWSMPEANPSPLARWIFYPTAILAAGIIVYLAYGLYKSSAASHGHDAHAHDDHAHSGHGHDEHGHAHDAHIAPADTHGHFAAHVPALPSTRPAAWQLLVALGLCIVVLWGTTPPELAGYATINLRDMLEQARPAGTALADAYGPLVDMTWPAEYKSHEHAFIVTGIAFCTALGGILLAAAIYAWGYISADEVRKQFKGIYVFLVNKWYFDELYDFLFVRPSLVLARCVSAFDKNVLDRLIDGSAWACKWFARQWDFIADRSIIDGGVDIMAGWFYALGLGLRRAQTGQLRQYVMFIVVGVIAVFLLISFFWDSTLAR